MSSLSICQAYFLCALTEKGKLVSDTSVQVCVVASALLDMIFSGAVAIGEDKKLRIEGELAEADFPARTLYEFIKQSKPMKVEKLASEYTFSFTDKHLKALVGDVGASLAELGYVTPEMGGMMGNTQLFIPNSQAVEAVIQKIRAELLEDGEVSQSVVALVSLLEKSNQIKQYFSKHERDRLKARLKQIKESDSNKLVKNMTDYIDSMITMMIIIPNM